MKLKHFLNYNKSFKILSSDTELYLAINSTSTNSTNTQIKATVSEILVTYYDSSGSSLSVSSGIAAASPSPFGMLIVILISMLLAIYTHTPVNRNTCVITACIRCSIAANESCLLSKILQMKFYHLRPCRHTR